MLMQKFRATTNKTEITQMFGHQIIYSNIPEASHLELVPRSKSFQTHPYQPTQSTPHTSQL